MKLLKKQKGKKIENSPVKIRYQLQEIMSRKKYHKVAFTF
jgi:hypothetical protein